MRTKIATSALALLALSACSIHPADSSSSSSTTDVTASGTLTGAVAGTISKATVSMIGNQQGTVDKVNITIEPAMPDHLTVTAPDPGTLKCVVFAITIGFSDVPTPGTYTQTSPLAGKQFAAMISYQTNDMTVGSFGCGTLDSDMTDGNKLSVVLTSVTKTKTAQGIDFYAVHGSIDATLAGGTQSMSGMTMKGTSSTAHIDF